MRIALFHRASKWRDIYTRTVLTKRNLTSQAQRMRNACVTQAQRMHNVCVTKAHVPVRTSTGSATYAYRQRNVRVPRTQRMRTVSATLSSFFLSVLYNWNGFLISRPTELCQRWDAQRSEAKNALYTHTQYMSLLLQ